jgi:hypothetical protein
MSEWITDRLPTKQEAVSGNVICCRWGHINLLQWYKIAPGEPWMPIPKPEMYNKPKRYTVGWNHNLQVWNMYQDGKPIGVLPRGLSYEDSYYAQRIADYYNKVQR